jgi:hypothetical protein
MRTVPSQWPHRERQTTDKKKFRSCAGGAAGEGSLQKYPARSGKSTSASAPTVVDAGNGGEPEVLHAQPPGTFPTVDRTFF